MLNCGGFKGIRELSFYFWKVPVDLISFCCGFVFEGFLGRFWGKFGGKFGGRVDGKFGGKLFGLFTLMLFTPFWVLLIWYGWVFIGCWLLKILFFF